MSLNMITRKEIHEKCKMSLYSQVWYRIFYLRYWPLTLWVLNWAPGLVLLPPDFEHGQYKWTQNLTPANWFALQVRTWICNIWKAGNAPWWMCELRAVSFSGSSLQNQRKCLNITLRFLLRLARYHDRVNWSWAGYALSSFIPGNFWYLNEKRWIRANRKWPDSWAVIYKCRNQV